MDSERFCPGCLSAPPQEVQAGCGHTLCIECTEQIARQVKLGLIDSLCVLCGPRTMVATDSEYHATLLSLPLRSDYSACGTCRRSVARVVCESGCGFLCSGCYQEHNMSCDDSHKVTMLIASSDPIPNGADPSICILHEKPIVSVCGSCWPCVEMCEDCEKAHRLVNRSHKQMNICDVQAILKRSKYYEGPHKGKVSELERITSKLNLIKAKMCAFEEKEVSDIRSFFVNIRKRIDQLEQDMIDKVVSDSSDRYKPVEGLGMKIEKLSNMLQHGMSLMEEGESILDSFESPTKLFKANLFMEKVMNVKVDDFLDIRSQESYCLDSTSSIVANQGLAMMSKSTSDQGDRTKTRGSRGEKNIACEHHSQQIVELEERNDELILRLDDLRAQVQIERESNKELSQRMREVEDTVVKLRSELEKLQTPRSSHKPNQGKEKRSKKMPKSGDAVTPENADIGLKVRRGKHWNAGLEDGGLGGIGVLIRPYDTQKDAWFVRWDRNGVESSYYTGAYGKYRLSFA